MAGSAPFDLQMPAQGVSGRSRLSQSHAWVCNEAKGLPGADAPVRTLVSIPMTGTPSPLTLPAATAGPFASQTVRATLDVLLIAVHCGARDYFWVS